MSYIHESLTFAVAQIGSLNRAETKNALGLANQIQSTFRFELDRQIFPLNQRQYRLPNAGFDLDRAVQSLVKGRVLPRPIIFVTSVPYGDRANGKKKEEFFVSGHRLEFDPEVSIVSTYFWDRLPGTRLQPYILLNLATAVLMKYAELQFHAERRECPFFTSLDPSEIRYSFDAGDLCTDCERSVQTKLRNRLISVEKVASAKRLFNRAWGRRTCFMIMPLEKKLEPVYRVVSQALREEGWIVRRADEIARPGRITDAILEAIHTSDLVVADLTGTNGNVFYELGFAHAISRDAITLTQERRIPFDVADYNAIFYKQSERGLRELGRKLRHLAGRVSTQ
jgi:hypothetical protein